MLGLVVCIVCVERWLHVCTYTHRQYTYTHHSKSCFSCKYVWLYSTDCPHSSLSHEIKYRLHMPLFSVCQVVCLECLHGGPGFVCNAVKWWQFLTVAMREYVTVACVWTEVQVHHEQVHKILHSCTCGHGQVKYIYFCQNHTRRNWTQIFHF